MLRLFQVFVEVFAVYACSILARMFCLDSSYLIDPSGICYCPSVLFSIDVLYMVAVPCSMIVNIIKDL